MYGSPDYETVPITYDAADTQATFTLPDGTVGAISYAVPWGQVDPTQASQSLTPTAFNVNLAGYDYAYAYGTASFSTAPTLQFAYGDLVGISFALSLTGAGSPYSSISVASGVATAVDAVTSQSIAAPVANTGSASITLDFSTVTIPTGMAVKTYYLEVFTADGKTQKVKVEVSAGASQEDVRNAFETALSGAGIVVKPSGTTKLTIQGSAQSGLKRVVSSGFPTQETSPKQIARTAGADDTYPTYDRE